VRSWRDWNGWWLAPSEPCAWPGSGRNLHDFYTGVERIFRHIASTIDRALPTGRDWHQELLRQMAEERPGIRPAVISDETLDSLDEYRRFRHVVRNIYAFQFDPVRLERLVRALSPAFTRARGELEAFADFLARLARVDAEASSEGPEPPRDELRYQ